MKELELTSQDKEIIFSALKCRAAGLIETITKTHDNEVKRILKIPLFETIELFEKINCNAHDCTLASALYLNLSTGVNREYSQWKNKKGGNESNVI